MKCFLLTITLLGALSYAVPVLQEAEQVSEKDIDFAKKYIEKYYYESDQVPVFGTRSRRSIPTEKLQQMQELSGLKVTGKLDPNTLAAMKKSRCGVPDIGEYRTFPFSPRWGKKNLTYSIQNYTPDMEPADVDNAIERAWKMWSDVTPLTFTRVYNDSADIRISFVTGDHGDHRSFKVYKHLAHAFSPAYGGEVHFNEDVLWSKDLKGINLFIVAAHEFGHSLGLYDSDVVDALMFSFYKPSDPQNLRLHRDDIEGIQYLYGTPGDDSGETKKHTPPVNISEEATSTELCDPQLAFDAVANVRGETLFFKDSFIWRKFPQKKVIEKSFISSFWPALRKDINAAYEIEEEDIVYLFKGTKYWATRANIIEPGFPRNIHRLGFPKSVKKIDAAVYDETTKKTYFFSGDKYWRYSETTKTMERGYPRQIEADFPNIGSKVDAAFQQDGRLYLFNGSKQYEFDSRSKKILGRKKANNWLGCMTPKKN
ncbi:stromelysin-1-like [Sceloporus undulatus]|uniref:stromelysin-1-like n=1 Tax=Sceloporus undulatus TaxID=8520 RepID=UPI001C4D0240|nr:stromelysin-1-like [Sceloporus undulatus]